MTLAVWSERRLEIPSPLAQGSESAGQVSAARSSQSSRSRTKKSRQRSGEKIERHVVKHAARWCVGRNPCDGPTPETSQYSRSRRKMLPGQLGYQSDRHPPCRCCLEFTGFLAATAGSDGNPRVEVHCVRNKSDSAIGHQDMHSTGVLAGRAHTVVAQPVCSADAVAGLIVRSHRVGIGDTNPLEAPSP